jgi:hypothetical protein
MKKIFLLSFLLLFYTSTRAQHYIISYDLPKEDIKYLEVKKNGDTVATPVINLSKSGKVNLRLLNVAGSFRETIEYKQNPEKAETIINPFWGGDMNGVGGLTFLKKISGNLLDKTFPGGEDVVTKALLNDEEKKAKEKFINGYNEFTRAYNNWAKAALFEEECKVLWKDLAGLRYSVQYPAEQAKTMTRTKTEHLFPDLTENTSSIQLYEMVMDKDPQKFLVVMKIAFASLNITYQEYDELLRTQNTRADSLLSVSQKMMKTANTYPYNQNEKNIPETVNKIANLYQAILHDSYTRTLPLSVDRNTNAAILKLTPVIDSATRAALGMKKEDTIMRSIIIYKKAPLRFRNTFGISFVSYAENRWHYFVKTVNGINTIEREKADIFQPVVMAFLHFYQPRDKGFRWGGSIGTGITVSGDSRLNIMMGLSTFFGRNDPVCFTAGISGAQVNKLSGYKTGDVVSFTELDANKNYNKVYRAGYFIALTFNPGGLSSKD